MYFIGKYLVDVVLVVDSCFFIFVFWIESCCFGGSVNSVGIVVSGVCVVVVVLIFIIFFIF